MLMAIHALFHSGPLRTLELVRLLVPFSVVDCGARVICLRSQGPEKKQARAVRPRGLSEQSLTIFRCL